jgi:hypothetical protein
LLQNFNLTLGVFNSILYRDLRPWKIQFSNKDYLYFLRVDGFSKQNESIVEFTSSLKLFFPNLDFLKDENLDLYELNNAADRINIISPLIQIDLPKAQNTKCRFYFYLITNEVTRLTDLLHQFYSGPASQTDKTYIINNVHAQTKHLIKETTKEYQAGTHNEESIYILQILRLSLVRFLLEVENLFPEIIKSPPTTDEELHFDLLDDELPEEPIYTFTNDLTSITSALEEKVNDNPTPSDKESFNFNGNKARLLNVITQLNNQIELLNEDITTPQQMVDVLTARDLKQPLPKIQFNTETTQVRYVFDKLSPSFSNLTFALIVRCGLFYTKAKKEQITKSNLSSSKNPNPKNKGIIDEIFRSL